MFGVLRSQLLCNVKILVRDMAFYAVAKGRKVGIYENWTQCEQQVKGFKGAVYKKFNTRQEAQQFISPVTAVGNYAPDEIAVPLGQRQQPTASWALKQEQHTPNNDDFWPKDMPRDEDVTDDDLLAAMYEVEGLPEQSSSRKRKNIVENDMKSKYPRLVQHGEQACASKRFGAFEFTLDSDGYVIVYTDGSCLGNGRSNACAGFGVYFGDDHQLNAAKPVLGRVTNNVGEIQAAIYAIKIAIELDIKKLCISTDSQFLIKSITQWVPGWKKRDWRLKNMEPVKNVADFKELDELLQTNSINVKWNYVEAHKGIKGNEMADKLAKQGSQIYKELNIKN